VVGGEYSNKGPNRGIKASSGDELLEVEGGNEGFWRGGELGGWKQKKIGFPRKEHPEKMSRARKNPGDGKKGG